jgi:hypothetical protein
MADEKAQDRFAFGDMNARNELAKLATNHLTIAQCAGGHQVTASGPCDHCGSTDPANQCLFAQRGGNVIGTALNTNIDEQG